jgi:hypothetical protein
MTLGNRPRGESIYCSRLTERDVRQILDAVDLKARLRSEYKRLGRDKRSMLRRQELKELIAPLTIRAMASHYGVSYVTVYKAIHGFTWGHVV